MWVGDRLSHSDTPAAARAPRTGAPGAAGAISRLIADRLGRCETLAYPYGVADARVADAARAAGYLAACVLTGAHFTDEPYRRPRVGLGAADTGGRLRVKVSGVGLGFRRSPVALAIRRARRRRSWQPQPPGQ